MFGPSQVGVDNGLTLTATPNTNQYAGTYPWLSGAVTTEGKFSLPTTGWYVQVEAKMPDQSQGMWPAIWFYRTRTASSPVPEIDLFEGGFLGPAYSSIGTFSNQTGAQNDLIHSDYGGGSSEYADYRDTLHGHWNKPRLLATTSMGSSTSPMSASTTTSTGSCTSSSWSRTRAASSQAPTS